MDEDDILVAAIPLFEGFRYESAPCTESASSSVRLVFYRGSVLSPPPNTPDPLIVYVPPPVAAPMAALLTHPCVHTRIYAVALEPRRRTSTQPSSSQPSTASSPPLVRALACPSMYGDSGCADDSRPLCVRMYVRVCGCPDGPPS